MSAPRVDPLPPGIRLRVRWKAPEGGGSDPLPVLRKLCWLEGNFATSLASAGLPRMGSHKGVHNRTDARLLRR